VWRAAHEPTAWKVTRVEVAGRKNVMGCGKERGETVEGSMLVRLRMNRTAAGCIEEIIYVSTFIFLISI
jgi:hypothetical protein